MWLPFALFPTISKKKERVMRKGSIYSNEFLLHTFWSLSFNSPRCLSSQTMFLLLVILSRKFLWKLGHITPELSFPMNHTLISARLDTDGRHTQMNRTDTKGNQHLILLSSCWTMRLAMFHRNLLDWKMYQSNVAIEPVIMCSKERHSYLLMISKTTFMPQSH